MRLLTPVLLGLALVLSGCAGFPTATIGLENTSWVVVSINGEATSAEHLPTMEFSRGKVSGSVGCNRYTGAYTQADDGVSFSQLITTQMACATAAQTAQESAFTAALSTAVKLAGAATTPELRDSSGKVVLNLAKPTPPATGKALIGTTWSLATITSSDTTNSALEDSPFTLQLSDSTYTATACTNFGGTVAIDGSKIKFTPDATSITTCASPKLTNQALTVIKILRKVESWTTTDSKLTLSATDGTGLEFNAS